MEIWKNVSLNDVNHASHVVAHFCRNQGTKNYKYRQQMYKNSQLNLCMLCSHWKKHNWQTVKGISRPIYLKVWVCLLPFASIVAEVVWSYEVQRAKARVRPLISRHFVYLRDPSRPSPHCGKKEKPLLQIQESGNGKKNAPILPSKFCLTHANS